MDYQIYTLPNGLRLIHKPEKSAVVYCGMVISTGSRDEDETEFGMAHFVEHMLFKGTEKRRSSHIISRLENVGGDLNAFTSKEETVVYAAVLNQYAERALELIADVVLHSTFPQKELEKEVEVVLDEIDSYNDSPSELIYDDFEDMLFKGHALGHHILGKPELLREYTTQDVSRFVARQYHTEKMVLFVSGDIPFKKLTRWADKYFQLGYKQALGEQRVAPQQYQPVDNMIIKNTHQAHVIIGNRAYDMYHADRLGLYLLNNILGGPGMSSLLNLSLREKHGLVYNVDSIYQPFSDSGEWCVYFGCDPANAARCEALVYKELSKLRENKLSDALLKKYKLQLTGQMAISSENKENMALSLGKSFLRYEKVDNLEEISKKVEAITANQLQRIANEVFLPEGLSVLRYR
ncbi:insulinase family protein [Paludibacter sp. 221]|uniref:M16 family metallopeptidase n=1 Tax=Paludibacter sp. 221 TaxID=2302939 RepID=UPI0013D4EA6D|nr:pitrilysin family protein [Paludibacter sp. 221]NDV46544.1 insulinase family protein [Paludibacter sp. 221]